MVIGMDCPLPPGRRARGRRPGVGTHPATGRPGVGPGSGLIWAPRGPGTTFTMSPRGFPTLPPHSGFRDGHISLQIRPRLRLRRRRRRRHCKFSSDFFNGAIYYHTGTRNWPKRRLSYPKPNPKPSPTAPAPLAQPQPQTQAPAVFFTIFRAYIGDHRR